MESTAHYKTVGLTVLILVTGLIFASIWLSVGFNRKDYNPYIIYTHESVAGLSPESPVKFNGVKVGAVKKITISQFDPQKVKILIQIEDGTPITESTYATLVTQGITGSTYLGLRATSPNFKPVQKTPGEPYPVIPSRPSFISSLEQNIETISDGFKRILNQRNAKYLREILNNLDKVSSAFASNSDNINQMLHELPDITRELKITVRKFTSMTQEMTTASAQVSDTMQAGKNTIEKIARQTLPPATALLERLDIIAANLEEVSAVMRQNPAVIIRGTTPSKPGPGE